MTEAEATAARKTEAASSGVDRRERASLSGNRIANWQRENADYEAAEKTFLLREFDDSLDPDERDIIDPFGGSLQQYLHTIDEIESALPSALRFIDQPVQLQRHVDVVVNWIANHSVACSRS